MVYRTLGLGATAAEKKQKKADTKAQRETVNAARDEWKRYVASLKSMDMNLRRGTLPPEQGLPQPPSSPPELVPDLYNQAKAVLENRIPAAREISRTIAVAKGNRAATSSYAAGQPPVNPDGSTGTTNIPGGELPGSVQQFITDAAGVSPVLQPSQAPAAYGQQVAMPQAPAATGGPGYQGDFVDPGQVTQQMYIDGPSGSGGSSSSPMKKILLVVGIGVAAWLAWKWFKGRK